MAREKTYTWIHKQLCMVVHGALIIFFGFYFYGELYGDLYYDQIRKDYISELTQTPPSVSIKGVIVIDKFQKKPSPTASLSGVYASSPIESGDFEAPIKYYFGDGQTIVVEKWIHGRRFSAYAGYSIDGSVMLFNDIRGAKNLLSEVGQAFSISDSGVITLHSASNSIDLIPLIGKEALTTKVTRLR